MKKVKNLMIVGAILCACIPIKAHSQVVQRDSPIISALKNEVRETKNWDEGCSDSTIQISYEDAQRLMKIAVAEAGNQGIEGQLRVMQVVWNRVQSPDFPDTIEAVISQPNQFQTYAAGTYETAVPTAETHEALALFEANTDHDSKIIAFETSSNNRTLEKYFSFLYTLKEHDFFTQKKKNP